MNDLPLPSVVPLSPTKVCERAPGIFFVLFNAIEERFDGQEFSAHERTVFDRSLAKFGPQGRSESGNDPDLPSALVALADRQLVERRRYVWGLMI
jgi:hypothetical protein